MGATPTMGTPAIAGTPNFAFATPAGALAMQMQTPTPGECMMMYSNISFVSCVWA